jgi:predicted CXXCH cytochrome family protein
MRVRTAKQRAQRIDLNYFKHVHGLKRWRMLLSLALPAAALLWVSALAAAGSRTPYSPGPVSSAHAFAETRCEACHTGSNSPRGPRPEDPRPGDPRDPRGPRPNDPRPDDPRGPRPFRAHTTDAACMACHDAPAHAVNETTPQDCATCHQEHRGRVQLSKTNDGFCIECHGDLKTRGGAAAIAQAVGAFPSSHPEFAAAKAGARDPGRLRFNHAVHLKDSVRGPKGPETLECASCHKAEIARTSGNLKGPATTGLMAPVTYEQNCTSCHPLFFDERIEQAAPHVKPETVRTFVQQALTAYISQNPGDITRPDSAFRRVPLNFPRPPEPPARSAQEWVERRVAADERLLWNKTCAECHEPAFAKTSAGQAATAGSERPLPAYAPTNVTKQWMPRAAFDHRPHLMVQCSSCHAAEASTNAADVLMPNQAVCATCHAPSTGALRPGSGRAESRCFECHQYHDWKKSHPVSPPYSLTDFK